MSDFSYNKAALNRFENQLKKVAVVVGRIVTTYTDGAIITDNNAMQSALNNYSAALATWANDVTYKMITETNAKNLMAWKIASKYVGKDLRNLIFNTRLGNEILAVQLGQVELIKTIPLDAGLRAQKIATAASIGSIRADEAAQQILNTEAVARYVATRIARTEIAKTNAIITQKRAQYVGVDDYIWRAVMDRATRKTHRELDGKVCSFSNPPAIKNEGNHGPGMFPNCRCFAIPLFTK